MTQTLQAPRGHGRIGRGGHTFLGKGPTTPMSVIDSFMRDLISKIPIDQWQDRTQRFHVVVSLRHYEDLAVSFCEVQNSCMCDPLPAKFDYRRFTFHRAMTGEYDGVDLLTQKEYDAIMEAKRNANRS
jgi:hypothetical protein